MMIIPGAKSGSWEPVKVEVSQLESQTKQHILSLPPYPRATVKDKNFVRTIPYPTLADIGLMLA